MKNKVLILIILCITVNATSLFSQQGQGNNMIQTQINLETMAGIIVYDADEVIKKLKIKNTSQQTTIVKAISKYNIKIHEIKTFNFETFSKVKTFLDKNKNEAMLNRDNITMLEAKIQVTEMLLPIQEKVQEQKTLINTIFEQELSPKQYSAWIKYQEKKHHEIRSKTTENQQMQGSRQGLKGSGQRQGMGRGRY